MHLATWMIVLLLVHADGTYAETICRNSQLLFIEQLQDMPDLAVPGPSTSLTSTRSSMA